MTVLVSPTNGPWSATLNIPADGESVNSASVLGYIQEVANRLEYLHQRVPGANPAANTLRITSGAEACVFADSSTNWAKGSTNNIPSIHSLSTALADGAVFLFSNLLAGQVIRAFNLVMRAATAHAALPASPPLVQLVKCDLAAALGNTAFPPFVVVDSLNDPSANTAAFQQVHNVGKALATPETVAGNVIYGVRVFNESGANALIGEDLFCASLDLSA